MLCVIPAGPSTLRCMIVGNGSLTTSVTRSIATVVPPPEYREIAPGVVSTRTGAVLAGFTPSRICGTVGMGRSCFVAGEPVHRETGVVAQDPPQRDLLVDGEAILRDAPGNELGVYILVEVERLRPWTSRITASARCRLADRPSLKARRRRDRVGAAGLFEPKPFSQTMRPLSTTAMLTPGT